MLKRSKNILCACYFLGDLTKYMSHVYIYYYNSIRLLYINDLENGFSFCVD